MKIKDAPDLPMVGKGDETCAVIASLPMSISMKARLYRLKTECGVNWCEVVRRMIRKELPAIEAQLGLPPIEKGK